MSTQSADELPGNRDEHDRPDDPYASTGSPSGTPAISSPAAKQQKAKLQSVIALAFFVWTLNLAGVATPRLNQNEPKLGCANVHSVYRWNPLRFQYGAQNLSVGGRMLRWALIFLVVAIVAGVLGFAGIMVAAAAIAKLLFYLFLVLFLISLVLGLVRRT